MKQSDTDNCHSLSLKKKKEDGRREENDEKLEQTLFLKCPLQFKARRQKSTRLSGVSARSKDVLTESDERGPKKSIGDNVAMFCSSDDKDKTI